MAVWFSSDHHFGHENIIRFCERPYVSINHMNGDLLARWNQVVAPGDTVYILGDFLMGNFEGSLEICDLLNGRKSLLPGNHDKVFRARGTKRREIIQKYSDHGVEVIDLPNAFNPEEHYAFLDIGTRREEFTVRICHFPYRGDSNVEKTDRFKDERPPDDGFLLLHGHTHGRWRKMGRMIDVGVDAWAGYPVNAETLIQTFMEDSENLDALTWGHPFLPYQL